MEKVCQYLAYGEMPSKALAFPASPLSFCPTLQHLRVTVLASQRPSDPPLSVGPQSLFSCDFPPLPYLTCTLSFCPNIHYIFLIYIYF